jgi:GNAT superfamily N-acetyltransferase
MIRKMCFEDIPEIMKIQEECYNINQIESPFIFISILDAAKLSCFVIEYDNIICGYIFAHMWISIIRPPKLHKELKLDKSDKFECIFIHDVAIRPLYQNRGYGLNLFSYLDKMYNMPFTLVAVNGSEKFWNKIGFKQIQCDESILDSYKCKAVYMMRDCCATVA